MAKNKKTYLTVITFLILEVLAFVSFNLTNSVILYAIAGCGLLFAVLYINIDSIKAKDFLPIAWVLIPLVIFALLHIVSPYLNATKGLSISLLCGFSLLAFFTLGYLSQTIKEFSISKGMLVIYGAISILMLLGLIFTLISYTPFYTWIYSNFYIYYQGSRILVSDSAKMLFGFGIKDITIQYFQLFGSVLLSSVVGLICLSPKKQTREFVAYCVFALIGLISVIFTINKLNLLTFAAILVYLLIIMFYPKDEKTRKILSYIFIGLIGIIGVLGIIFILNALDVSFVSNFISSNGLLNRLFNTNRISVPWVEGIKRAFSLNNLFGLNLLSDGMLYSGEIYSSGNIFIDAFAYTGIIGGLAFAIFTYFAIKQLIKYYFSDHDDKLVRTLITGFIGSFFIYSLFAYDMTPIKDGKIEFEVLPFTFHGLFMIVLFLIGRTFILDKKEKQIVNEEISVQDSVVIESEVIDNE